MRTAVALSVAMTAQLAAVPAMQRPPAAPVRPVTETLHGVTITDPYRSMEDGGDEFSAWLKTQDAYTRSVLDRIAGREKLVARVGQLNESVPQVDVERLPGDRYLLRKQLKLYIRERVSGKDRLLVDPDKITLAPAGRSKGRNAVSSVAVSPDGKYVAVGITPGGSETDTEIHVFETGSGRETGDVIIRALVRLMDPLATYSWLPDSHSFVYRRLKDPVPANPAEARQRIRTYVHVLGHRNPCGPRRALRRADGRRHQPCPARALRRDAECERGHVAI
jgi:prolyl oligopeptidase